jgi:hypothetical protein
MGKAAGQVDAAGGLDVLHCERFAAAGGGEPVGQAVQ